MIKIIAECFVLICFSFAFYVLGYQWGHEKGFEEGSEITKKWEQTLNKIRSDYNEELKSVKDHYQKMADRYDQSAKSMDKKRSQYIDYLLEGDVSGLTEEM